MRRKKKIKPKEKVLLLGEDGKKFIVEVKDQVFHTHKGMLNLKELEKKEFGSTVETHKGYKLIVLKPNIIDFIEKIREGPQRIIPKDAALIVAYAGIKPNDVVVEGGTGRGCLTAFLANVVGKNGKVISYEIREQFARWAKQHIEFCGLSNVVKIKKKNIYEGIDEKNVDAIVLDVPEPEKVVEHALKSLKVGSFLVSYVPCLNQVLRLYKKIEKFKNYFDKPFTIESMVREQKVSEQCLRPKTQTISHTGYITFVRKIRNKK